jgi:hypothetical protein
MWIYKPTKLISFECTVTIVFFTVGVSPVSSMYIKIQI